MSTFFASLFEWWGLNPLYSVDLGDHLRGYDITCTDYISTPWYANIGWIMIGVTVLFYAVQYHIIDSPKFLRMYHWWLIALVIFILNFIIAFIIPFNAYQSSNYCNQLIITPADCVGFGISVAVWSLILFIIITSIPWPRGLSTNCRQTTFWKP